MNSRQRIKRWQKVLDAGTYLEKLKVGYQDCLKVLIEIMQLEGGIT